MMWEQDYRRSLAEWLAIHGVAVGRTTLSAIFLACAVLLTWQLTSPLLHRTLVKPQDQTVTTQGPLTAQPAVLIARIQERHLFGDSTPAAQAPVLTSSGSVSVIGIVYSPQAPDSVALLSVAGNSVVSHVGSQLATGQTVTAILPDRVQLSGGTGSVNLLLDIKQADTDQRINPGQYANDAGMRVAETPANEAPDAGLGGTASAPAPRADPTPTHFESLRSLRGGGAAERFRGLGVPTVRPHPPR